MTLVDKTIDESKLEDWTNNPDRYYGYGEGWYRYSPYKYTLEASITGRIDKSLAGGNVSVGISPLYDNNPMGYFSGTMGGSTQINNDGSFSTVFTQEYYTERVPDFVLSNLQHRGLDTPQHPPQQSPNPDPALVESFISAAMHK